MRKILGWACVLAWAALGLRAGGAEADAKKASASAKTAKTAPKKKAATPSKAVGKTGKKAASSGKTAPKTAPKTTSAGKAAAPAAAGAKTPAKSAGKAPARTAGKKGAASKRGKQAPRVTWRNRQTEPTPERYKEIQSALAAKGFLDPADASGGWGPGSVDALKKFQAAQNIEVTGKIDSLSLIALGLGPKRETAVKVPETQPAQPR